MKIFVLLLGISFLFAFDKTAAQEDGSGVTDLCEEVTCGANSECVVNGQETTCQCDNKYVEVESVCIPEQCAQITCTANSQCVINGQESVCQCNAGFVERASSCQPEVCSDNSHCPANSFCNVEVTPNACKCEAGYVRVGEQCISLATGQCVSDIICPSNSVCNTAVSVCVCNDGYVAFGQTCIEGCSEVTLEVQNSNIKRDVNCDNSSYVPASETISATFAGVRVGVFSKANVECSETCDNRPREIGARECLAGGQWAEPTWTDCSRTLQQQTPAEQLTNQLIATSDAAEITTADVQNTLTALQSVETLTQVTAQVAATSVTATANLLQATDTAARQELINNLESIFGVIAAIGQSVPLTTVRDGGVRSWETEEVSFAICVIGGGLGRAATNDRDLYYGPIAGFKQDPCDIKSSVMTLWTAEPTTRTSYIAATPREAALRINFQMYCSGAFDVTSLTGHAVEPVVFSAEGEGLDVFTMKFKLNEDNQNLNLTLEQNNCYTDVDANEEMIYKSLRAKIYNSADNTWKSTNDTECDSYSADGGYALITCSTPGIYTLVEETRTEACRACSLGAVLAIIVSCVASSSFLTP